MQRKVNRRARDLAKQLKEQLVLAQELTTRCGALRSDLWLAKHRQLMTERDLWCERRGVAGRELERLGAAIRLHADSEPVNVILAAVSSASSSSDSFGVDSHRKKSPGA